VVTQTDSHTQRAARVVRLSKFNGWSVACIAGGFAVLSLFSLSLSGIIVGAAVCGAGVMEIKGHQRLESQESGARGLMAGSQVVLVGCVVLYCWWRLWSFDPADPLAILGGFKNQLTDLAELALIPIGQLEAQVIQVYTLTYQLVAGLTLLLQGGLGLYYWVQVGRVEASLRASAP